MMTNSKMCLCILFLVHLFVIFAVSLMLLWFCTFRYVWESKADGAFAISEDTWNEPLGRGTEIRLHLRDEAKEYLEEDKLKVLPSYCHLSGHNNWLLLRIYKVHVGVICISTWKSNSVVWMNEASFIGLDTNNIRSSMWYFRCWFLFISLSYTSLCHSSVFTRKFSCYCARVLHTYFSGSHKMKTSVINVIQQVFLLLVHLILSLLT